MWFNRLVFGGAKADFESSGWRGKRKGLLLYWLVSCSLSFRPPGSNMISPSGITQASPRFGITLKKDLGIPDDGDDAKK